MVFASLSPCLFQNHLLAAYLLPLTGFRLRLLAPDDRVHIHQEHTKIIQLTFQNLVDAVVVYFAVQMHQDIPKANHFDVHRRALAGKQSCLLQCADTLAAVTCDFQA